MLLDHNFTEGIELFLNWVSTESEPFMVYTLEEKTINK